MEFTSSMFWPLLTGHLLADFWLQPNTWVRDKNAKGWRSSKLLLHTLLAATLPVIFTFNPQLWWFIPVIGISHFVCDWLKSTRSNRLSTFLIDQFVHLTILILLSFIANSQQINPPAWNQFFIYTAAFIGVSNPAGIITGLFLQRILPEKNNNNSQNISAWIGIFERILILIFILAGQFTAIGFLIAAKSIFRFNDTRENGNIKAEYFLLGTLVSFTLAIVTGLLLLQLKTC